MTTLAQYEQARAALAKIVSVNEAVSLLDEIAMLRHQAKRVQDRALMADAAELQFRAETRLGELLIEAEKRGFLHVGRPKKNAAETEGFTLKEIGIGHKLSASSQHKASISERAQLAMIERMREKILSGGATIIEQVSGTEDKKERRANRERVLGECQEALPNAQYGVIVADPEWRFEPWSRSTGMDRAADNHYPTSCLDVIAARPVADIAAKDCVLFLWATAPMLPHALAVMDAWGFEYRSNYVWSKDRIGTGYWNRNAHEHLLIGVKGDIPAPAPGTQRASVMEGRVTEHSAKPECFLEMIEQYFPTLPKIELNRRGPARKGWAAWGNEAQPSERDPQTGEVLDDDSSAINIAESPAPALDHMATGEWAEKPVRGKWIVWTRAESMS